MLYKCSSYYPEEIERGIAYDDPELAIAWPEGLELIPSDRDAAAPRLSEIADDLPFRVPQPLGQALEIGGKRVLPRTQGLEAVMAPTSLANTPFSGRSAPPDGIVVSTGATAASKPAPSRIARVNSNHEQAPALVR